MALPITVEFSGGVELLCGNVKKHNLNLPTQDQKWKIRNLLEWIRDNIIQERPELFMQRDTVRPGILVLINEADWELKGELDYELEENDRVVFISTLHGG